MCKNSVLSRPLAFIARFVLLIAVWAPGAVFAGGTLDRIVAVVEDDVVLASELQKKMEAIKRGLAQSKTQLPPDEILARQVLERLIIEKIQLHLARKAGIRVDDETLQQAVQQIAQRNKMSPEELRRSLREEGIEYADFIEQIRGEITVQRLRGSQVNSQIKVSDREVQQWLETQSHGSVGRDTEFLLGHILIATPRAASPAVVQKARERAERLTAELKQGLDFKKASLSSSDSPQALSGGDLGWRKFSQIPTLFADAVAKMKEGDIEGPIHSPSGFHIIKLLGVKGGGSAERIVKTHVRHILIKPNEVLSDEDAQSKLKALKDRIEAGDDFATLARGHSDDKGSAIKGGDLGWVQPGALVPEFEDAMSHLDINRLSDPVQSQFGWHLIQVLEREESDDTDELLKKQAREELFKRKVEEETELWMRRIRDEAYVEIRLDEPAPETFIPASLQ
jgi:peptidyl-prolyl cis-trans isomerase SurA